MARPYFRAGALSLAVLAAVFISKLLGVKLPTKIPPNMLRYVIKYTYLKYKVSPSKFAGSNQCWCLRINTDCRGELIYCKRQFNAPA